MRDFLILFVHLIGIVVRLAKPCGLRSVVAESVLVRHQLLMLNRGRKRAPNLRATDRIVAGGRDRHDAAIRRTSAQSDVGTKREWHPAWPLAQCRSALCVRAV